MRFLPIAAALVALAACHPSSSPTADNASSETDNTAEAAAEPHKGIDRSHKGTAAPAAMFDDADGKQVNLARFAGKPVLVNLWATWCAPCVKELPTLDQLAQQQGTNGALQVVAISQDMGPHPSVVAFLQSHDIATLKANQDAKMALSGALGAEVLPTSILFDAQGREVWRYVGDLDWTGPEAAKLLAEAGGSKAG